MQRALTAPWITRSLIVILCLVLSMALSAAAQESSGGKDPNDAGLTGKFKAMADCIKKITAEPQETTAFCYPPKDRTDLLRKLVTKKKCVRLMGLAEYGRAVGLAGYGAPAVTRTRDGTILINVDAKSWDDVLQKKYLLTEEVSHHDLLATTNRPAGSTPSAMRSIALAFKWYAEVKARKEILDWLEAEHAVETDPARKLRLAELHKTAINQLVENALNLCKVIDGDAFNNALGNTQKFKDAMASCKCFAKQDVTTANTWRTARSMGTVSRGRLGDAPAGGCK